MFFLLETRDGSPIVVAGPCWPFCTFVTTPLIVILSGMVGYFIVSDPNTKLVSYPNSVVFVCVSFLINLIVAMQHGGASHGGSP